MAPACWGRSTRRTRPRADRRQERGPAWPHRIGRNRDRTWCLVTPIDACLRRDRPAGAYPRGILGPWPSPRITGPRRGVCGSRTRVGSSSPSVSAVVLGVAAVVGGPVAFHESLGRTDLCPASPRRWRGTSAGLTARTRSEAAPDRPLRRAVRGWLVLSAPSQGEPRSRWLGASVAARTTRWRCSARRRRSAAAGPGNRRDDRRDPLSDREQPRQARPHLRPRPSRRRNLAVRRSGLTLGRRSTRIAARTATGFAVAPSVEERVVDAAGRRFQPSTRRCACNLVDRRGRRGHGPDDVRRPGADHRGGRPRSGPQAQQMVADLKIAAGSKPLRINPRRIGSDLDQLRLDRRGLRPDS